MSRLTFGTASSVATNGCWISARESSAATWSGRRQPGRSVRVSSTRLVSFTHRAVAAVLYEVEPLDGRIPVVAQSELVANEPLPDGGDDPRVAAALRSPLRAELAVSHDVYAALVHWTKARA